MKRAAIITASDSGYRGEREDLSGPAIREILEREGYEVQVLEFIDMEHTPKNILIRAIDTGKKGKNSKRIKDCETFLNVEPTLGRLLGMQKD